MQLYQNYFVLQQCFYAAHVSKLPHTKGSELLRLAANKFIKTFRISSVLFKMKKTDFMLEAATTHDLSISISIFP